MSDWGRAIYGDPCRECGYDWSISQQEALSVVASIPARYAELLRNRDGRQRHPSLDWSVGAYACHVGDNLRIWAERLAGASLGSSRRVVPYDQDLLARTRGYEHVPLEAALWSLERAVGDWLEEVRLGS
jgi:hypothetical protein